MSESAHCAMSCRERVFKRVEAIFARSRQRGEGVRQRDERSRSDSSEPESHGGDAAEYEKGFRRGHWGERRASAAVAERGGRVERATRPLRASAESRLREARLARRTVGHSDATGEDAEVVVVTRVEVIELEAHLASVERGVRGADAR